MPTPCGTPAVSPYSGPQIFGQDRNSLELVARENIKDFYPSLIESYYSFANANPVYTNTSIYPTVPYDVKKAQHNPGGRPMYPVYTHTIPESSEGWNDDDYWTDVNKEDDCAESSIYGNGRSACCRPLNTLTYKTGLYYISAVLEEIRVKSNIFCAKDFIFMQDYAIAIENERRAMAEQIVRRQYDKMRLDVAKNSFWAFSNEQFFNSLNRNSPGSPFTVPTDIGYPTMEALDHLFLYLRNFQGTDGLIAQGGMQYLFMIGTEETLRKLMRNDPYHKQVALNVDPSFSQFFGIIGSSITVFRNFIYIVDDNTPRAKIARNPLTGQNQLKFISRWKNVDLPNSHHGSGIGFGWTPNPEYMEAEIEPVIITGRNAFARTVHIPEQWDFRTYFPENRTITEIDKHMAILTGLAQFQFFNDNPLSYAPEDQRCNDGHLKGHFVAEMKQGIMPRNPNRSLLLFLPTGAGKCAPSWTIPIDLCIRGAVIEPECPVDAVVTGDTCCDCENVLYVEPNSVVVNVCDDTPSATIRVSRGRCNEGAITLNYTTVNQTAVAGTDYTTTAGTLTWADGVGGTQTITVPVIKSPVNQNGLWFRVQFTVTGATIDGNCNSADVVLLQKCDNCGLPEEEEPLPLP